MATLVALALLAGHRSSMPIDIEDMRALEDWFGPRVEKLEAAIDGLTADMIERSHNLRGSVDTMALQLTELVTVLGELRKGIEKMESWREVDGPVDKRFKRHSARLDSLEKWQTGIKYVGALMVIIFTSTIGLIWRTN